jgi:hypothetical protein
MKAATKVLVRRMAREREARALENVRVGPSDARVNDRPGLHLPLTYAPYRLQAADRWWRELPKRTEK